jgi:putative transposase
MQDRDHLRRLSHVWITHPVYFLTACTIRRKKILACPAAASVLSESWLAAGGVHGWVVGRYVIMPDHVHFFARPHADAKPLASFVRDWKKWTTRQLSTQAGIKPPLWQSEFFDHVLRSPRSYSEKWDYVHNNPVRAGLVDDAQNWPYAGECELLQL